MTSAYFFKNEGLGARKIFKFFDASVLRPYMPNGQKVAEVLKSEFEKIGVRANIVSYEWGTYLEKTGNGEHQMALLGWGGDNGDPDNFLYVLLDKDNTRTPDAGNIAFYVNDELHELLIQAQRVPDVAERTKLYKQAQEIIKEDAPWLPLVHSLTPMAGKAEVKGYVPHAILDRMTEVTIEQ